MAKLPGKIVVHPEIQISTESNFTLVSKIGMFFMKLGAWMVNKGGISIKLNQEK